MLADYLATAEKPSLEDFIARNAQKIAILGEPVKDLKALWTGRYVKSTKLLDIPAVNIHIHKLIPVLSLKLSTGHRGTQLVCGIARNCCL